MTRSELISELAASLGARHEARFIVDEVLGRAGSAGGQIDQADLAAIGALAARRLAGEPLQYVFGHWAFRTLDLLVDARVLIPRPETEQVVEVALREIRRLDRPAPTIVDAGTGSGAIALSMAVELADRYPRGRLWGTDTSREALAVAVANLDRVDRRHDGTVLPVTFVHGSWLSSLPPGLVGSVDLVVSNPPYVAAAEWPDLSAEVRREPAGALVSGDSSDGTPGLGDVQDLLSVAWAWLARPGGVVIELAPHQAEVAVLLAQSMGYRDVVVEPDLSDRLRVLVGRVR